MLKDRVEELNNFLNYIISNIKLYTCDSLFLFFDDKISNSKIGEILNSTTHTYQEVETAFKKLYPNIYM